MGVQKLQHGLSAKQPCSPWPIRWAETLGSKHRKSLLSPFLAPKASGSQTELGSGGCQGPLGDSFRAPGRPGWPWEVGRKEWKRLPNRLPFEPVSLFLLLIKLLFLRVDLLCFSFYWLLFC